MPPQALDPRGFHNYPVRSYGVVMHSGWKTQRNQALRGLLFGMVHGVDALASLC